MIDAILEHWGGATSITELKNRENRVFAVTLANGTRAALRLHRPGYQSRTSIESELWWMTRLADKRFQCPTPIITQGGQSCVDHQGQIASLISWIDGQAVGEMGGQTKLSPEDHCTLYHDIGVMIRDLHTATDAIDTAGISRPAWDSDALLGDNPAWGRFWENPALTVSEKAEMSQARHVAQERLQDFASADFGLIHADIMQENMIQNETGLWLIDFDDSGVGYRLYDAGTAMIQHSESPYFRDLLSSVSQGYGAAKEDVHFFMALRAFASAGWAVPRLPLNDPKQRIYAERGLSQARWLLS